MRAIIRFSIDGEKNSALRNKLAAILEQAGFVRSVNTATYTHNDIDPGQIGTTLANFWASAQRHRGNGRVDHFWMYSDRDILDALIGGGDGPVEPAEE